jgi:hypothetical protein
MAKQTGEIIIEGTIDGITFYKMEGKGYARKKSSLTGKKVKRDPRFKRTMQSAHRFGRGNQLASKVYRSLLRQEQVYALFKELKRIAVLALKEGKEETDVLALLQQRIGKIGGESKTQDVIAQQQAVAGTTRPVKKTPRLFRVQGSRVKAVRKGRPNGLRHRRRARPAAPDR